MDFQDELQPTPSPPSESEFVVIGAGLAGLTAALTLHRRGREVVLLELGDAVGGRVRTDFDSGFTLDRGFQVLLTAYPEIANYLDLAALDLRPFARGVNVRDGDSFTELLDPRSSPSAILAGLRTQLLTPTDRIRLVKLALRLLRSETGILERVDDLSVGDFLKTQKFSDKSIEKLWEPLLSGIQLTSSLEGSARLACLIIRCLVVGPAAVPAKGMQEIPDQMAARLPGDSIHLRAAVEQINGSTVFLAGGQKIAARRIVIATEEPSAARLLNATARPGRSQWHAYFSAVEPPNDSKAIHLLPSADGPCRNIAIMSNVAPEYAPQGSVLVVAAGPTTQRDAPLAEAQQQLTRIFGSQCESWKLIKHGIVEHAQPVFVPGAAFRRRTPLTEEVVIAGDHRTTPSIQGAMVSGRIAAETAISGG
tara:strand:+ start:7410 stop:8675 length:1266 start_codon:yes stop_codon:yes gene_type:complete